MEIDLSQNNFTVKEGQTDERESTSNEPAQTNSAEIDSKTHSSIETDLKKESSMEIDFAQKDNPLNDSVEEKESIDKKLADANSTEADSNKEDFMEINSTQEIITVNVSVEESESTETKDEKTADKESVNDGLTDLYSNKEGSVELCVKKDETTDRILAEEDCEAEKDSESEKCPEAEKCPEVEKCSELEKDSELEKNSEAEEPTEVSMKENPEETEMMKEPTEINSAEKESAREEGSTVDDMVNGEPTEENDQNNGSQQDSVKDQIASTSISKPKRKYYKNPIVLIKSKKRRLSSNSL
ncbi:hypothetical protein G6F42_023814 [Rhizopus arrhizus]|nr:hypothetical protein G6F42_023814 [Rhizopus arrhizus]